METLREVALCTVWKKVLGLFQSGKIDEAQEAAELYAKIEEMTDEEFTCLN